jgi:hypothetical protein
VRSVTGTPLDLTPFGSLLSAVGVIYWLLAALGLWWALRGSSPWRTKLLRALPMVLLFGFIPGRMGWESYQARRRLDASMVLFNQRCKTAGERIYRSVENVDGIVWMKWRSMGTNKGQFTLDDPYGKDCSGDDCIKRLLRVTKGAELNPEDATEHARGYRFVETIDPGDGQRYRYIGVIKSVATRTTDEVEQYKRNSGGRDPGLNVYGFALQRDPITSFTARFGIAWDDLSAQEDREHWIAGGALKAIDLQTNGVIAERIGYLIDSGQGSTAGFRDPWGWAQAYGPRCPGTAERTWNFSTRVLRLTKQRE